jgi:hypothetical protein
VTNPNAATEQAVLTSAVGIRTVAVGLQGRFGNALEHAIWVPGVVAGELGTLTNSQSNHREFQRFPVASLNSPLGSTNLDLLAFWSRQYATVRAADDVLATRRAVPLAAGTRSGVTALAKTLKARASARWPRRGSRSCSSRPSRRRRSSIGRRRCARARAARLGPRGPRRAGPEHRVHERDPAARLRPAEHDPGLSGALRAGRRQYEQALTFANEVPATATSEFRYSTVDQNPIWGAITGNRYFGAAQTLRTGAEAGDARVTRLLGATPIDSLGGARALQVLVYRNPGDAYPLFTQDELTLIRAEAHARLNRLPQAATEVNRVRTAAGLAARPAADLASQQAVLDEILRQRRLSLFLTGQAWADLRRFGRVAEARVPWLPYPEQERASNPNTPANP